MKYRKEWNFSKWPHLWRNKKWLLTGMVCDAVAELNHKDLIEHDDLCAMFLQDVSNHDSPQCPIPCSPYHCFSPCQASTPVPSFIYTSLSGRLPTVS